VALSEARKPLFDPGKHLSNRLNERLEMTFPALISGRKNILARRRNDVPLPEFKPILEEHDMSISRIEPWALMNLLHRDLDQIAGRRLGYADTDEASHSVADWVPAVDVIEETERFVIRADLPGVGPEDIDVNMENGVLSLSGERKIDNSEESAGLKRFERVSGRFFRRFNLPETANPEAISARSANGILEISIPKQPQIQARRITVEAA
jgi:HSP20 family protein